MIEVLDTWGRDATWFPNLIATMWLYVADSRDEADHVIQQLLAPILGATPGNSRRSCPSDPLTHCIELLRAYNDAGAHQVLL